MDASETATEGIALDELRAAVRLFAEREIAPLAADIDASDSFPRQLWPMLGDLGVLGPTVPGADGGAGLGFLEHLVIVEEVSRASASVGLSYAAHSNLCVHNLWANGTPEQRARWLPPLLVRRARRRARDERGRGGLRRPRVDALSLRGASTAAGSRTARRCGSRTGRRPTWRSSTCGRRMPAAPSPITAFVIERGHGRVQRGPAPGQARDARLRHVRAALRGLSDPRGPCARPAG